MAEVTRSDALALINQQNANEIWEAAVRDSAALRTFRRYPMSAKQARMPVIDALPTAGFVGETSGTRVKPTSGQVWANKMLEAEELAVIVPIPENVFDDTSFGVWEAVRPRIAEAVGAKLDGATFFGVGKPVSWPADLNAGARAAGNVYDPATAGDLAEDLNQTMALVEADGFDVNVFYSNTPKRATLRGLRDSQNRPIYVASLRDGGDPSTVWGEEIAWVRNGSWVNDDKTSPYSGLGADFIAGDRNMAILGIRQDMTFKILDQATLTDPSTRAVLVSLAEEDMIALRCKMRVGFQVADPTTIEGGSGAYPFAVLGTPAT